MPTPPKKKAELPRPNAARVHPTLKAWLSEEKTQERLAALIVDPVFNAFCYYLTEGMKVQPEDMAGPKALLSEEIVRKAAMHTGACQIIPAIKRLLAANTSGTPTPAGWEHLHPNNQ